MNKKNKTAKIELRVSEDLKAKLKENSEEAGLNMSEYITDLLEYENVVVLKDGAKIADELMKLRIEIGKKGFTQKADKSLQALILKMDGLIDSFPQNSQPDKKETPDEDLIVDCTLDADDDYDVWDGE